jgi:hypothetical protein
VVIKMLTLSELALAVLYFWSINIILESDNPDQVRSRLDAVPAGRVSQAFTAQASSLSQGSFSEGPPVR